MHRHLASKDHDFLSVLDRLMQRRSVLTSVAIVHTLVVGGLLLFSVADLAKKAKQPQSSPVASRTLN